MKHHPIHNDWSADTKPAMAFTASEALHVRVMPNRSRFIACWPPEESRNSLNGLYVYVDPELGGKICSEASLWLTFQTWHSKPAH